MFLTVHAAAGAVIGQYINEPALAFLVGFASHFILDIIPHGDESIARWSWFKTHMQRTAAATLIDFFCLVSIALIWIKYTDISQLSGLFYGLTGAMLPDALWGFNELTETPLLNWYSRLHSNLHRIFSVKITFKQGLLVQIPILIICSLIIIAN